jgi:uncharacterized membrane protein
LFWLSLFPFATGWMGENHFTAVPTALYGVVLLMAAIAYYLLQQAIIRSQGPDSILKKAVGRDWKGKVSPVLYVVAIVATLGSPWIAEVIFVTVALIWLIPDRRIENVLPRQEI